MRTISVNSSNNPSRRKDFAKQIAAVKQEVPTFSVGSVQLDALQLNEQLDTLIDAHVFISVIGGSASFAMFLERNSCVILFFNDKDDFVNGYGGKKQDMPTMMDFDFWNNAAYLHVHWLPMSTMDTENDITILTQLIQNCLSNAMSTK